MFNCMIIGVDIGTSGTKAIAFSTAGEVVGSAYKAYDAMIDKAGMHELNPEELFDAVVYCIKQIKGTPLAISFSAAMHSLIAVDQQGKPLTNVITWADNRSTPYAEAIRNTNEGQDIYQHTGTPIHPMSPLCKLIWLQKELPEVFKAAHKFISIKEYIFFRFFNKYLIDHSIASGTGLFDIYKKEWYAPSLKAAGITADRLSTPVSTTHIIQGNVPYIIGASDGVLANLGSNATKPGDASITIGTSGAVRMINSQPKPDEKGRVFNYILTDKLYVSGGPINNGLAVLKWYAENFLHKPLDIRSFVEEAAKAPTGADGLIFLPYLLGERAPIWDARAKGVFLGIHAAHTQAHFMRAIIEGINYAIAQVAQSVEESVGAMQQIFASGGFIHSPIWLQWLTDLLGKEIIVINKEDASSIGAAILGMQALNIPGQSSFFPIQQQYLPNATAHARYQPYYSVYTTLYTQLKPAFNTLAQISEHTENQ